MPYSVLMTPTFPFRAPPRDRNTKASQKDVEKTKPRQEIARKKRHVSKEDALTGKRQVSPRPQLTSSTEPYQQDLFPAEVRRVGETSPHHSCEELGSRETGAEDAGLAGDGRVGFSGDER